LEEINSHDGSTIAIVVRKSFDKKGINFLSEDSFPLQLGVNSYKKGHKIKSHFHKKREIIINSVQEVIYFKSGSALVNLYGRDKNLITSLRLSAGDLIFLVDGGHGFEMAEDTTFIEVKQGPYFGKNNDKELIEE
jgi:hypothetical protein